MVIYKSLSFIVTLNTAALLCRKPASAKTSQDSNKRITTQNKKKTFLIPLNCETHSTGNYNANRNNE